MLDHDMPLPPNTSSCDGKQTELVHELMAENENEMQNEIKLASQSGFLHIVLYELIGGHIFNVDVSPVIDSIKGLVDVLDQYESEHL